jgi:hypothetical protein
MLLVRFAQKEMRRMSCKEIFWVFFRISGKMAGFDIQQLGSQLFAGGLFPGQRSLPAWQL